MESGNVQYIVCLCANNTLIFNINELLSKFLEIKDRNNGIYT